MRYDSLEKLSSLINASTNMNSSLSKISQYCHNFLKSLISGLRQYLIWSGWTELAAADPRKVGSHLSLGEQVGGVWVGQIISIRVGHSHFSYSDVSNQIPEKFEWSKWVQLCKTPNIRIFNVVDFGRFGWMLGRYGAVLAGTWRYLVSMGRYWLVLGGAGSV